MAGAFPGQYFYLLQDNMRYFKEDDPVGAAILVIGIAVTVITVLIVNAVRNRVGGNVGGKKTGRTVTPRKFNGATLRRIANSYRLDRDQTKLLEYVFRLDAVGDPLRVMNNPALLDRHFRQAYRVIERNSESEEDAQLRLARLFALRNVLDASPGGGRVVSSTDQISESATAVLSSGRESYPVRVVSAKTDNLLVECPRNALGSPIRLIKGTKISLAFFTKSSTGFSFDSRVLGTVDTSRGLALQCAHSRQAKPLAQRRFRRKQISANCIFFLVFADETRVGRKKVTKLVVDRRRFIGTILDISVGGCSIKTSSAIPVGSRLKITLDNSDGTTINALGQVLRTNRSGAMGIIMHIKFLKIPRKAMNAINAMVFGFYED